MDELEILTTSDGSHTLRNRQLNETYHSVHGALQESLHVFIKNGLEHFHQTHKSSRLCILEIGFGTGLNALLALEYSLQHNLQLNYTTLEPYPLTENIWSNLNYAERDRQHYEMLHKAPWGEDVLLAGSFTILKKKLSLQDAALDQNYDTVFFDAFAPSVQPELWTLDVLRKVVSLMKVPGVFVTYSAKGQLKRDLKASGLMVETLPGPPGKNEMVRATKTEF